MPSALPPLPPPPQRPRGTRSRWLLASTVAALASLLPACKAPPQAPAPDSPRPGSDRPIDTGALASPPSNATTARAYRKDAATHLYGRNAARIYQGKLPPMLYAIGVLEVDIDANGRVMRLHWMRAPRHAPEVVAEIERTVRAAAPFPLPARLGRVTYTDTWLWDKQGHFQLDTLTEGQL